MNIVITGAAGHVGYDLTKYLLKKDHKVFAIYRSKNFFFKKISHKSLTWKKIDLKNKISFKKRIDVIIHCAVVHNFSKKKEIADHINSNIISFINLIDFAKKSGTKLIINFSTMAIYGDVKVKNLNENYIPSRQNLLGVTKYFSENILFTQPINFINLRLPGILCSRKNNYRPWLQLLINKIKKNKNIYIHNINGYFNNVIDTKEIAKLILKLIRKKKMIKETFNLSASQPLKLKKIINLIKSKYKSKSKIINKKENRNSFIISIRKIEKKLNFFPESTQKIILRNL